MVRRLLMRRMFFYLFFCSVYAADSEIVSLIDKSLMMLDQLDDQEVYIPRIFNKQLFELLADLADDELISFLIRAEQSDNKYLLNGTAAVIVDRLEVADDPEIMLEDARKKVSFNTCDFIQKYINLKNYKMAMRACGDIEISVADYVSQYDLPIEYLGNLLILRFDNKNLTSLYGLQNISLTDVCLATFTNNCIAGNTLDPQFPDAPFQGLDGIYNILINKNNIESLPSDFFNYAPLIHEVDIAHNKLTSLPGGLFSGLDELSAVRLSHNQLGTISSTDFSKLDYLSVLYLDNNSLLSIPTDLFQGNPMLADIYLSNNAISTWPADALDNLTQLSYLDLSYNLLIGFAPNSIPDGCQVILTGNTISVLEQGIIQASYPNVYFTF